MMTATVDHLQRNADYKRIAAPVVNNFGQKIRHTIAVEMMTNDIANDTFIQDVE